MEKKNKGFGPGPRRRCDWISPQAAQGRSGEGTGIARAGREAESRRSLELAARARPGERRTALARPEEEMGRGTSAAMREQISRFRPGDSFSDDPDSR